jgi:hypothetical protein
MKTLDMIILTALGIGVSYTSLKAQEQILPIYKESSIVSVDPTFEEFSNNNIPNGYRKLDSGLLVPDNDTTNIVVKEAEEDKILRFNLTQGIHSSNVLDRGKIHDPNPAIIGIQGGSLNLGNFSLSGSYLFVTTFNSDLPKGEKEFLKTRENSLLFGLRYSEGKDYFSLGYNIMNLDVSKLLFEEFTAELRKGNFKIHGFYDINHKGGGLHIGYFIERKGFSNETRILFDEGYITENKGVGLLNKMRIHVINGLYIDSKFFIALGMERILPNSFEDIKGFQDDAASIGLIYKLGNK